MHAQICSEREIKENVCKNVHVCFACVCTHCGCAEAACLPELQEPSYLRGRMVNMGLQHLCCKSQSSGLRKTHEAHSTSYTSMWLKIDNQHRISEAACRWASGFWLLCGKRGRGRRLWLEELNKDCVGVRVIPLVLFRSPHSFKTLRVWHKVTDIISGHRCTLATLATAPQEHDMHRMWCF